MSTGMSNVDNDSSPTHQATVADYLHNNDVAKSGKQHQPLGESVEDQHHAAKHAHQWLHLELRQQL